MENSTNPNFIERQEEEDWLKHKVIPSHKKTGSTQGDSKPHQDWLKRKLDWFKSQHSRGGANKWEWDSLGVWTIQTNEMRLQTSSRHPYSELGVNELRNNPEIKSINYLSRLLRLAWLNGLHRLAEFEFGWAGVAGVACGLA
ncbi:hypothetical protein K438DRAFT_1749502 [Mycena galopus ATCC 62051]|nr:hypothetical protein K438DRAFT_1749502 [Mycena galopus ATCC 62051]